MYNWLVQAVRIGFGNELSEKTDYHVETNYK